MSMFRADTILAVRRHVEDLAGEHGEKFTGGLDLDRVAASWADDRPWRDPEVAIREWAYGLGVLDPDTAEELYRAGVKIAQASVLLPDGRTIAAAYVAEDITLDEAVAAAGVDPLAQLRSAVASHADAAAEEDRRRDAMVEAARTARNAGVKLADVLDVLGVTKPTFYDWMRQ